jgi:phenylalanyl-tRNA synthetase alpha chain
MKQMGSVPKEQRPGVGKLINETKGAPGSARCRAGPIVAGELAAQARAGRRPTLPSPDAGPGTYHPLTLVREEMCRILRKVGFAVADGPEVETEYYCFDALQHPADHPARDAQDTFYLPGGRSSATSKKTVPGGKIPPAHAHVVRADPHDAQGAAAHPHRVARAGLSARHHGRDAQRELPSARVSLRGSQRHGARPEGAARLHLRLAAGQGHQDPLPSALFWLHRAQFRSRPQRAHLPKVNKEWIEIGGCGMVDPAVFDGVGYDLEVWSGYAFGMGLERLAMLLYGIDDIRYFYQNDLRFLKQFA